MTIGRTQIVLLGASNLTRALPTVVDHVRARFGPAVDIFAACGNGRSYGNRSHVLMRDLPPILGCELWSMLAEIATGPCYALIADYGNDIAFGASVADVRGWLADCLDRLVARGARTVVLQLPLATLRRITARQVWFLRHLIFSAQAPDHTVAIARAEELATEVETLARVTGAALVEQDEAWFGFDPIHIRMRDVEAAWSRILGPWTSGEGKVVARPGWLRSTRIRSLPPARRWLFGKELRWRQPAGQWGETRLYLY